MARDFGDIGALYPSASQGAVAGIQNMQSILGINDAINKRYADAETLRQMQFAAPNAPVELKPFNLAGLTIPESQIAGGVIESKGNIMSPEVVQESAVAPTTTLKPPPAAGDQSAVSGSAPVGLVKPEDTVPGTTIKLRSPSAAQNIADWEARTGLKLPDSVKQNFPVGQGMSHLTVPDFDPKKPAQAGLVAAEGVPTIDPNSAGFQRWKQEGAAKHAILQQREAIATELALGKKGPAGAPSGQLYGYFFDNKSDAEKRDIATAAMKWFRSDESLAYFMQNPQALAQAKQDPAGFFAAYKSEAPIREARRASATGLELPVNLNTGKAANVDAGFAAKSATLVDKRITELTAAMDNALKAPQTQQILARAGELQVDPAAVLAVYGLETSFGATNAASQRGATGPLQVTQATFNNLKTWFTNPQNIQKYGIPEATVAAAKGMDYGSNDGKVTGGLLTLKYNELIGVPKNLWGAGYQGNADVVLKRNQPLNAHDGSVMNADYNRGYVALYNEALTRLTGVPAQKAPGVATGNQVAAAPVAPPPAAPAPAVVAADTGAHPVVAAADTTRKSVFVPDLSKNPPTQAKFDMDTKTLLDERNFITTQAKAMENSVKQGLNNELARVQMEHQNASAEFNFVKSQYDAAMRTGNRPLMLQLQPQLNQAAAKVNMIQTSYNNAAKSAQDSIVQLNQQLHGAMKNNETALWAANARMAYSELVSSGDPRRMQAVWSQYSGGNKIDIQQRTDGKWNLSINGVKSPTAFDTNALVNQFRETVEEPIRALNAQTASARNSFIFQETTKSALKQQEKLMEQLGEGQIKMIEGKLKIREKLEGFSKPTVLENGKAIVFPNDASTGIAFLIDVNPESFGEDGVLKPSAIQPVRLGVQQAASQSAKK